MSFLKHWDLPVWDPLRVKASEAKGTCLVMAVEAAGEAGMAQDIAVDIVIC